MTVSEVIKHTYNFCKYKKKSYRSPVMLVQSDYSGRVL